MRKILLFMFVFMFGFANAHAAMGSYNPDFEDGIFDRVKFHFFKKDKKFIEIVEPSADREKVNEKKREIDEHTYYKYMMENTVLY